MLGDDAQRGVRGEGHLAGDELVEHRARRVEVGPHVEHFPSRLLGRHVLGRAADEARHGDSRAALGFGDLGDAEVADLHHLAAGVVLDDHHVLGLQVAVDDAGGVRGGEGVEHLAHHTADAPRRQRRLLFDHLEQVGAVEQLHRDVEPAVLVRAEVDDLHRVGVREPTRRARLAVEALDHLGIASEVRVQHLDRHVLLEALLSRGVHPPHGAFADPLVDAVLAVDDGADHGVGRIDVLVPLGGERYAAGATDLLFGEDLRTAFGAGRHARAPAYAIAPRVTNRH